MANPAGAARHGAGAEADGHCSGRAGARDSLDNLNPVGRVFSGVLAHLRTGLAAQRVRHSGPRRVRAAHGRDGGRRLQSVPPPRRLRSASMEARPNRSPAPRGRAPISSGCPLDEMRALHSDFGLVGPAADEIADAAGDTPGLALTNSLGTSLRARCSSTTATTSAGSPSIAG
jgi:hypothetical protein